MGAGVRDAFPPPMCCVVVFIHLRMETPLCGRSGGHTRTAPTVSFGWIACGTVDFVWVDYAWMVGVVGGLRVDVRPYAFRLGGDICKCRYSRV